MATLREALQSAMAKQSEEAAPEGGELEQAAPLELEEGQSEAAETTEPAEASAPAEKPVPKAEGRDEKGRFTARDAAKELQAKAKVATQPVKPTVTAPGREAVANADPKAAAATPAAQAPEPVKAPQSWKPAEREAFAKAPPEVQAAVLRREKEITDGLGATAEDRKFAASMKQAIQPYEWMIKSAGVDAPRMVDNLLRTATALQTGSPQNRAQVIATLFKQSGVSLDDLAVAIDTAAGIAPKGGQQPSAQQPFKDPRVDQLLQQHQVQLRQAQEAARAKVAKEIEDFAKSHEFFEDVRRDMSVLEEVLRKQGVEATLEDLYNRAVRMSPELVAVLEQREKAKQAENAKASTQRARAAASPVRSQPAAPTTGAQPQTLREQLRASAAKLAGR